MNNVTGTVTSMRKDRKGLKVGEQWYGNKFLVNELTCNTGDKVEVTLDEKGYLQTVVIKEAGKYSSKSEPKDETRKEERYNVDAGNCVQRAVELINGGKKGEILPTTLEVVAAFKAARIELKKPITDLPHTQEPSEDIAIDDKGEM